MMSRLPLKLACCAVAGSLALAGSASASHDPSGAPFDEDFATGRASLGVFSGSASLDAHSGPLGESPRGTAIFGERQFLIGGPVTCLTVTGNRATIGGVDTENPSFGGYLFAVEDNAATGAPDGFGWDHVVGAPTTCPADPSLTLFPVADGDLVVHDAQPFPTSKDQCKNGGWRNYGGFKNQGQCILFVIKTRVCKSLERFGYTPKFCPPRLPRH